MDAGAPPAVASSADAPAAVSGGDTAEAGEDDAADGEGGDDETTSAGGVDAPEGTAGAPGTGKRKRRRRKKRKNVDGATAADGSTPAEGGEAARHEGRHDARHEGSRKKESHAPFAHMFTGAQAAKRHAFAPGEVVAGRVLRVEHGVIVVDLFGKAIAVVDEYEPREIAPLPEPVAAPTQVETPAPSVADATQSTSAPEVAPVATEVASAPAMDVAHTAVAAPEYAHDDAAALANDTATTLVDGTAPSDHEHDHDHEGDDADDAAPIAPAREKPEAPKLGQVFKGRVGAVAESGHIALINRIVDVPATRAVLEQRRAEHARVEGIVYGYNRGGFDVLVDGLRAFCPASAMSLDDIQDPLEYVGKKLEFLLPASKAGSKDIIVSRRSILERLQRRKNKEFLRSITPGQRFKGKVTAAREFGLFVDIGGGVEGLVHQSELSYAFGVKPASVAQPGDEIDVVVLRVGGEPSKEKDSGRRDRVTRVSLSVKALLTDPWDEHAAELAEGTILKGKVSRATEFGAFIELVGSIEGLLHITELGRDLKHANQAVREGDEIYVAIDRVDRRARRISLSKLSSGEVADFEAGKLLPRDDAAAQNLRQGNNVKIKIEKIEPRCVFGRVAGTIGKRGRAFIPNSETGTDRGTDLRKKFPPGSEIEAKIIGIDRDGSLKCSIKAMQVDEERQAVKNYRKEAAKQGFGTFGDLLRAKLGEASK